jgi:hypothetical protein
MSVDAIVDLVSAAATTEKQTISHSMMRLLSKLAKHAGEETGTEKRRQAADENLRDAVGRLVGEWTLEDPNPDAYRAVLEHVSRAAPLPDAVPGASTAAECEPERIVEMALEIGVVGAPLWRAVERLERDGKVALLMDLVEGAPPTDESGENDVADQIFRILAERETLRRLLAASRIDFALVERLVRRKRLGAAVPLLDALNDVEDIKSRERICDLLLALGVGVGSIIVRRLAEVTASAAPSAVLERDLLALLGRLPELPATFDARAYLRHAAPHVRRETVKLLLKNPATRDEALLVALMDPDERTVYLALTAGHERCPREGIALARARVERGELDPSLRALAIRMIATVRGSDTLQWLSARVVTRSAFLGRLKLLPPAPEVLSALTAIVAGWRTDPNAAALIALATKSRVPAFRAALRGQTITSDGKRNDLTPIPPTRG